MVTTPEIEDAYICVMGVTGAGKSSFIKTCSGKDVEIGHELVSCTAEVEDISFMYNDRLRIHLIDTPGFDDTNKSDVEILQNISHWLATSFQNKVRLKGIIFLHRISDPRMTGAARRNLNMFKKLCGDSAFKSCVLATTMWSQVNPAEGARREKELMQTKQFWGSMASRGSVVWRYLNTKSSAHEIIDYILSLHFKDPLVLDIQDELVTQKKPIEDTSAAVELNAEIMRERQKHQAELERMKQEMREAIEARDEALQEEFQEEINGLQEQIRKGESEQRKLTQTLEEVHKRKEVEFEAFKEQLQREQDEAYHRYQQDLERQRREAEEQATATRKLHETEIQRLQKLEDEFRRQRENFDLEMQQQQEAQMEALKAERARQEMEYEAARQRDEERHKAELHQLKEDMERQHREREERLSRRQPSWLGQIGAFIHGILRVFRI